MKPTAAGPITTTAIVMRTRAQPDISRSKGNRASNRARALSHCIAVVAAADNPDVVPDVRDEFTNVMAPHHHSAPAEDETANHSDAPSCARD